MWYRPCNPDNIMKIVGFTTIVANFRHVFGKKF